MTPIHSSRPKNKVLSNQTDNMLARFRNGRFATYFGISFAVFLVLYFLTGRPLLFTVPKYKHLFHDYGVPIPWAMRFLIHISDWFADDWGWALTLFLVPGLSALLAWRCHTRQSPARPRRALITWLLAAVAVDALLIFSGGIIISGAIRGTDLQPVRMIYTKAPGPPADMPGAVTATIDIPDTAWKVIIKHPPDWIMRASRVQPGLDKPGKGSKDWLASWWVGGMVGTKGRTIEQITELSASATSGFGGAVVKEKRVETRADGQKVGIVLTTNPRFVTRDTYWLLDADTLLIITEAAPPSNWDDESATLAQISASAVAVNK